MVEETPLILSDEVKILACVLRSRDFCNVASQHIKPSYFSNPVRHNIAKMALEYYKLYNSPISFAAVSSELGKLVKSGVVKSEDIALYGSELKKAYDADMSDAPYITAEYIQFVKHREWRKLIEEAVKKHLPKGNFADIESTARAIAEISATSSVEPYDYYDDNSIDERTKKRNEEAASPTVGISTGIKRMDDAFPKKGWYVKELYVILAPPKRGKTMSLLYFANQATWQGFNAAYFTLEVSKEVCSDRIDAMNTSTEIKHMTLPAHIAEVQRKMKLKKPTGKLLIYEYPTKCLTSAEIERQLQIAESKGMRIDIVFVDYGDIMKPMRRYDNHLKEEASVFEELRAMAVKFVLPVITASQVNREGSDKEIIKGKHIAGTWEKIMVADGIISLSASDSELKDNIMKIHFAECRNMPSKTLKIKTEYGVGKFYKEFIEELR